MHIERDQVKTLIVLGCLAAAFVLGLWLPHQVKISRLHQRISSAQKEMGFEPISPNKLTALNAAVLRKRDELNRSTKYVPETTEIAELLRQLSSRLEQQQVVEQELLTRSIEQGDRFSVIPVSLQFRGTFPSVFGFIRDVEAMRRMMRITRIELSHEPTKPDEPLEVRIELCTFSAEAGAPQP